MSVAGLAVTFGIALTPLVIVMVQDIGIKKSLLLLGAVAAVFGWIVLAVFIGMQI